MTTKNLDQLIDSLTPEVQEHFLELLKLNNQFSVSRKIDNYFTDEGANSRESYSKHVEFLNAGAVYNQRAFVAGNQCGKTLTCAYEMTLHLTGLYPHWWKGKRYRHPVRAWAVSISGQKVRDNIQNYLLGPLFAPGTGMIPADLIAGNPTPSSSNVSGLKGDIPVKHFTDGLEDGISWLTQKSYSDGREKFQGEQVDVIWLDEEDKDQQGIYDECITRFATRDGSIFCSFTPLYGLSDMVKSFIPDLEFPSNGCGPTSKYKFVANVTWDDIPHISKAKQEELMATYDDESTRLARSRGIPGLGAGLIYPINQENVSFKISREMWGRIEQLPRAYAMDIAYTSSGVTAALWGAYEEKTDTWYIYDEYYSKGASTADHAAALKAKGGKWMSGVIDPAAERGISVDDTRKIITMYNDLGLYLSKANNSVFAGIETCKSRFLSGRLKICFTMCPYLAKEIRLYRKDEKGEIIKKDDHLVDCLRYLIMSGQSATTIDPDFEEYKRDEPWNREPQYRDSYTGY